MHGGWAFRSTRPESPEPAVLSEAARILGGMESPPESDARTPLSPEDESRFDATYSEAKAAVGYAANQLRALTDLYRESHREMLTRWHRQRDDLERRDRRAVEDGRALSAARTAAAGGTGVAGDEPSAPGVRDAGAATAEEDAEAEAQRAIRRYVDVAGAQLGEQQRDLSRLELATRHLEATWLFLEHEDASLAMEEGVPLSRSDLRMRIVQAQEEERVRLAQEIHDGPAQMIANAFFQVDYVERLMERDPRLASTELRYLREVMRRELADIRSFISQLRPPALDELGLDGAIRETVATFAASTEVRTETSLTAQADVLTEMQQTVVLRILQEALQNVRKHATARTVTVATTKGKDGWTLEVGDDGRGFDIDAVGSRGRRNFGLRFMQERAELVGGRLTVKSRPGAGTIVRLTITTEGHGA
jgi:two-component system sensor histidine kinase DegS